MGDVSGSGTLDDFVYKRLIVWQKAMILFEGAEMLGYIVIPEELKSLTSEVSRMPTSMLKKFDAIRSPTPTSHSH